MNQINKRTNTTKSDKNPYMMMMNVVVVADDGDGDGISKI